MLCLNVTTTISDTTRLPMEQASAIIGSGFPPQLGPDGDAVFEGSGVFWPVHWTLREGRVYLDFDAAPLAGAPGLVESSSIASA
jgi:hypothetical protein